MRIASCLILCLLPDVCLAQDKKPTEVPRPDREAIDVEGWTVFIDARMVKGDEAALGKEVVRVLGYKLYEIKQLVKSDRLGKLQKVKIVVDLDYPLRSLQYHPSIGWLKSNNHDPRLDRVVHIPRARALVSRLPINQQPMVIMHELAHAYHDQFLGFDEPRIEKAWARFKESGKYEKVLHIDGNMRKHYALTNAKEFFAEMTEAYFGTNDFYPFVRGELRKELPDLHTLLVDIWN